MRDRDTHDNYCMLEDETSTFTPLNPHSVIGVLAVWHLISQQARIGGK